MEYGVQQRTPRASVTPRAPLTPRGGGDASLRVRSHKKAPPGPVESSTEDEMVYEKREQPGGGSKHRPRNEIQVQ